MSIRLTIVLAAAGMAAAAAAQADMTTPAGTQDWTGWHLGLSFGGAYGDGAARRGDFFGPLVEADVRNGLFPDGIDDGDRGAAGGVSVGYDRRFGAFVGGIEADLSALDLDAEADFARVDPEVFPGVITATDYRTEISGLATLRLRGGVTAGRTLVYGTAGIAAGRVKNDFALSLPNATAPLPASYASPDWSETGTRHGYVAGAGIERRMTDRLSLRAEAMYFDLEDVVLEGRDAAVFPGQGIDYSFENDGYLARIGASFRF